MQMTKKILSIVLAVLMVVSMMAVMAVSASAAGEVAEIVTVGEGGTGSVGDQFASVNDAVNAAGEGGEVKLIADINSTGDAGYVGIDGTYTTTLDLNGHNITANGTSGITLYSKYPGGKTFTIKGSGTVTCTPRYAGDACISDSSGRKVVIKGGTYTNTVEGKNALYVSSDQGWTIEKGTFNGNIKVISDLTVKGGTINGDINATGPSWTVDPASVTITGGTVNGELNSENGSTFEVTGGTFSEDVTDYVDTTVYKVKYTATNGKVSYKTNIDYSNVSGSGTYQLLGDLTANSRIVPSLFASNVVFDLNGFTLTSTATDEAFLFSRAGSASNHNSYTIKNGTVVAAGDGVDLLANNADLTLENVDIVANGVYGVVTNGTKTGNNITATDSSITAGTLGIYKPSNGSLTLTDTDVTGKTAVYVKSGDVTIDGGTFTGTGAAADYAYNGNGANITGDAVVIDNCGYPGGAPSVSIVDGTFVSDNGNAVASYVKQDDPTQTGSYEKVDGFIEGGNFSSDVTPLVVAGKKADDTGSDPDAPFVIDTTTLQVEADTLTPYDLTGLTFVDGTSNYTEDVQTCFANLLGVQVRQTAPQDKTYDVGDGTRALRYVAAVSKDFLQDKGVNEYGFEVKVDNKKVYKSCVGTYNNVIKSGENEDYTYFTFAIYNISKTSKDISVKFVLNDGTETAAAMYDATKTDPYTLTASYDTIAAMP